MTIETVIDWVAFLPAAVKFTSGITIVILLIAYASMRPGDPTI
jgi:hypothetical protein